MRKTCRQKSLCRSKLARRVTQSGLVPQAAGWPKLGIALAVALGSLGLTGCFKVSRDVQALRDGVVKAAQVEEPQGRIELGVGALTLNLARAGLAFVDLEPEARTVLHAVRSAEVGVYKFRGRRQRPNYAAVLSAADKTMAGRGWDRVVGVMNRNELVAIYVPAQAHSTRNVKVCVVALNGQEMVIASARSNLETLTALALDRVDRHTIDLSPLRLSALER